MPADKLRIRHVDPRTLTPAPYNPNLMTETARAKLRRSLEEYGFVEPVVVNTRTGWLAGIEDTPLLELTGFDFDQYQALQITQAQATKAGREGYVGALPAEAKTR